jgi:DNA-binding NarL/FixJ family response regulator
MRRGPVGSENGRVGTWLLSRTRILLADLPQLLREIVTEALEAQSDMEVVGSVADQDSLARTIAQARPEVIVTGHDDPEIAAGLLERRPPLAVIAVTGDAKESEYYELRPQRVQLGEISPSELVEAIRQATRSWSGTARANG